jgi:PKD repeat protein
VTLSGVEGRTVVLDSRMGDPGSADTHTFLWQVQAANGQQIDNGNEALFSFLPTDNGLYTVTLTVTDDDGSQLVQQVAVNVTNAAPTGLAILGIPSAVAEGDVLSLAADFTDAGTETAVELASNGSFAAGLTGWTADAGIQASVQNGELVYARNNAAFASAQVRQTIATQVGKTYQVQADVAGNTHGVMFLVNGSQQLTYTQAAGRASFTFTATSTSTQLAIGGTNSLVAAFRLDNVSMQVLPHAVGWSIARGGVTVATGKGDAFDFTPRDSGAYSVNLTVTDKDGGIGTFTQVIQVANVAPQGVSAGQNRTVNEGQSLTFSAAATDPGLDDSFSYLWRVTADNGQVVSNGTAANFSFVPADSGNYLVRLTVTDDDGGATSHTVFVDALNVAPTVELGATITVAEGTPVVLNPTVSDPAGANDTLSYAWTVTDGQGQVVATGAGAPFQFTPADNGSYGVSLTVTDDDGASTTDTVTVQATNVAPVVTAGGNLLVNEGSVFNLAGSFTDPGMDTWLATVNYGDGVSEQLMLSGQTFTASHVYADSGTYPVTVSLTDDDGATGIRNFSVTVANVAPSLTLGDDATVNAGQLFLREGLINDPGADTWTVAVNYGDGTPVETLSGLTVRTFGLSHTYAARGAYAVSVLVTDDDGATGRAAFQATVNGAPTLAAIADQSVAEGQALNLVVTATDPQPTQHVVNGTFDAGLTGWTPDAGILVSAQTGELVYARNNAAFATSLVRQTFATQIGQTYTVQASVAGNTHGARFLVNGVQTLSFSQAAGQASFNFTATSTSTQLAFGGINSLTAAFRLDNVRVTTTTADAVTYSLVSGPEGASIDPVTGQFTWTPTDGGGSVEVTVRASDDGAPGLVDTETFTITVNNVPPVLTVTGPGVVDEDSLYTLSLAATDVGTDTLTKWTINWGDGLVETEAGDVTAASHVYTQSGQYQVSVSATDEDGTYTATGFAVTVNNVNNDAPVLAPITTQVVAEGSTLSFVVTATDPDGVSPDRLTNGTFSAGLTGWTLDAGILASVQNGELVYARNNAAFGSAMVRQTIATQAGQTYRVQADVSANTHAAVFLVNGVQAGLFSQAAGKANFTFTATGASTQLAIGGTNALVAAFRLDNVRVNLDGANAGDILTYSLVSGPAGASINPVTGQFTWAAADGPVAADVTVRVQDDGLPMLAHERTFSVAVTNVAPALTVSGAAATFEDLPYVLTLSASADPGQDTRSAWQINWGDGTVDTLPGNATQATHVYDVSGTYTIGVSATDEDGTYNAASRTVLVRELNNDAPVLAPIANQTVAEGSTLSFLVTATDTDGVVPDLATNGTFSAGLAGWTPDAGILASVQDGQLVYARNNASFATSLVRQTITTQAGQTYRVLADVSANTHAALFLVNGVQALTFGQAAGQASFTFVATGASTQLSIGGTNALTAAFRLDNVRVHRDEVNLASNGSFDAGLTGWTPDAGIQASVQNGQLVYARNNAAFASAMIRQTMATQAGQSYRVQADVSANTHAAVFMVNGVQALTFGEASGKAIFTFTATGASTQLAIGGTNSLAAAFRLDNVRVNPDGVNVGDLLTYSLVSGPAGASINPVTGQFTWTAPDGPVSADVTVRVQDDGLPMLAHERTFSVSVTNVAPTLTVSGAAAVDEDLPYVLTLSATADPGQDTRSAWQIHWGDGAVDTLPGNAAQATHVYTASGNYAIDVSAIDEDGSHAAASRTVQVRELNNDAPVLAPIASQTVAEGSTLSFVVTATDSDGVVPDLATNGTFSAGLAGWTVDAGILASVQNGQLVYARNNAGFGSAMVRQTIATQAGQTYRVLADVSANTHAAVFLVNGVQALTFSQAAGQASFTFVATGASTQLSIGGTNALTAAFRLDNVRIHRDEVNVASNGSFDAGLTGWTPDAGIQASVQNGQLVYARNNAAFASSMVRQTMATQAGQTYRLQADVSANTHAAVFLVNGVQAGIFSQASGKASFTFTATGASTQLAIGGTNSLAAAFRLDNVRVNPDGVNFGDLLTYSLVSGPAGASINPVTGEFTWAAADGPTSANVTVRVQDDGLPMLAHERSFVVAVTNVAPTLTVGGAAAVDEDLPYVLTLSATDPGQDTRSAWQISWGDGAVDTLPANAAQATHVYTASGNYAIAVSATDEDGSHAAASRTVQVREVSNDAPMLAPITNQSVVEGATLSFVVTATDSDGVVPELVTNGTFSAGLAGWTVDSGILVSVQNGQLVYARNNAGFGSAMVRQTIATQAGQTYRVQADVSANTHAAVFLVNGVQALTFSQAAGTASFTFVATGASTQLSIGGTNSLAAAFRLDNVYVRNEAAALVTNGHFATNLNGWTLDAGILASVQNGELVYARNNAAFATAQVRQTIATQAGQTYRVQADVSANTHAAVFLVNGVQALTFSQASGTASFTFTATGASTQLSMAGTNALTAAFRLDHLTVQAVALPVVSNGSFAAGVAGWTADAGLSVSVQSEALVYARAGVASANYFVRQNLATEAGKTYQLRANVSANSHAVRFLVNGAQVSDFTSAAGEAAFSFVATGASTALAIGGANDPAATFRLDDVRVNAVRPGDRLTYELDTAPAGMSLDPVSGVLRWTAATAGSHQVKVRVSDDGNPLLASSVSFLVQVSPPPGAPLAAPAEGQLLASDAGRWAWWPCPPSQRSPTWRRRSWPLALSRQRAQHPWRPSPCRSPKRPRPPRRSSHLLVPAGSGGCCRASSSRPRRVRLGHRQQGRRTPWLTPPGVRAGRPRRQRSRQPGRKAGWWSAWTTTV